MTKTKLWPLVREYLGVIKNDYLHNHNTTEEYTYKSFHYAVGKKYVKVIHGMVTHSFIVNVVDDEQFKYGDILKAKSFDTPDRDAACGNVFVPDSYKNVSWVGCL